MTADPYETLSSEIGGHPPILLVRGWNGDSVLPDDDVTHVVFFSNRNYPYGEFQALGGQ